MGKRRKPKGPAQPKKQHHWRARNTKEYWDSREVLRDNLARDIEASMQERMRKRKQQDEEGCGER